MAITAQDLTPNFINPQYASPEQLKSLREYADQLQSGKGQQPVHRWTQGVSNIVNALVGGGLSNQANQIQSQAAAGNASDQAAIIAQLQNGKLPDPATQGRLAATPLGSPEQRALIGHLTTPQAVTSPYGQPGYISPNQNLRPVGPTGNGYDTGAPASQSVEGASQSGVAGAPSQARPTPTVQGGMFGGTSKPVGWDQGQMTPQAPGAPQAGAALPAAPPAAVGPNGAPSAFPGLDALAAKGRELAFQRGNNESQTSISKQDIEAAATAPTIKRVAGTMLDDLKTHGDKMTFGPTAEWSNNVKRIAANYAPGAMKDQLESIASADSFDKMSAQLTSMLAKGGGTDAQLFNNMKSVPGAHNSKEGAEALLKMVNQVADQQMALRQATAAAPNAQQYEAARTQFYAKNPVINPLTGNPIALDLQKQSVATAYEKTATNPQTGEKLGLRNGKWEPIK